jgi:hypothetical protein
MERKAFSNKERWSMCGSLFIRELADEISSAKVPDLCLEQIPIVWICTPVAHQEGRGRASILERRQRALCREIGRMAAEQANR